MQYKTDKEIDKEIEKELDKFLYQRAVETETTEEKEFLKKIYGENSEYYIIYKGALLDFILSQCHQDREAIREWVKISRKCKFNGSRSPVFIRLTDLLSFLDGLEGE